MIKANPNDEFHALSFCIQRLLIRDCTTQMSLINTNSEDKTKHIYLDVELIPRFMHSKELNKSRTQKKVEVLTPVFIVDKMNSVVADDCRSKSLDEFIDSTMMEITCGEAPFLTTRYDSVTGEMIPVKDRKGLLDRKLQALACIDEQDKWIDYAVRALQSIYGYEYQADSLIIARLNLLMAVSEAFDDKFQVHNGIPEYELEYMAEVISFNLFQMDGLRNVIPTTNISPKVKDWMKGETVSFKDICKE